MEIERKFLIKTLPENLESYPHKQISQGYISDINPSIRIRQQDDKYLLTIKSVSNVDKDKQHLMNNEIEFVITKEKFYNLSTKVENTFIEKTRYYINLGDLTAELDVFKNALSPLITVEVEFNSEEEALSFQPPDWFGLDVTADIRYKNFHLSTFGLPKN